MYEYGKPAGEVIPPDPRYQLSGEITHQCPGCLLLLLQMQEVLPVIRESFTQGVGHSILWPKFLEVAGLASFSNLDEAQAAIAR